MTALQPTVCTSDAGVSAVVPVPLYLRTVQPLVMACPGCGVDALWQWTQTATGATVYTDVDCPTCDHSPGGEPEC